jgi:hypothetical protein
MTEGKTPDGRLFWTPTDPNDVALLSMAEGATMGETTLPSGWKSPEGTQLVKDGLLYEVPAS